MITFHRLTVRAAVAVGALAAAPAAGAATVSTGSGCYRSGATTAVATTGLAPNAPVTVAGRGVGLSGTSDAAGNATLTGPAPNLVDAAPFATEPIDLRATDGVTEALARYEITNVTLRYAPRTHTASHTVRWRPTGFAAGRTVYAHYVRAGRARRTVDLGPMPDRCAYLPRRVDLVPGRRPARGAWTVQLDTARAYDRSTPGAISRRVVVR